MLLLSGHCLHLTACLLPSLPAGRQPYHIGGTAVLEVSAVAARKWTDWLFRERLAGGAPDAADAVGARSNGAPAAAAPAAAEDRGASREAGPLVVLHLGVDAQATHFKLESVAANEATFRVPDQRGWQVRALGVAAAQRARAGRRMERDGQQAHLTLNARLLLLPPRP